ncbi:hypothetical protein ACFQ14_01930 [Pseudahrensia aquimaris]|uniref:Uncharacterized protein n=1 Tax=Pseudahrensia aquimaris TaxID=744461 RepID=A0ABW3FC66_9HYPH
MTLFAKSKSTALITTLAAAAFLAGCQSRSNNSPVVAIAPSPKPQPTAPAPAPTIEGKWVPKDASARQVYYNEFRKGKFGAYSADGKNTLALGSYTATPNGATIKYYSEANKRNVTANCVRADANNMTCTTDSGSVAELVRA